MDFDASSIDNLNSENTSLILNSRSHLRLDTESLEAQLDRLNSAVAGLIKPEDKELCDSFSIHGYEGIDSSVDFIDKFDTFIQQYDRTLMVVEDYRSNEIRKEGKTSNIVKARCRLSELYEMKAEIKRGIKAVESRLTSQVSMKIGELQVLVDISMDPMLTQKARLCKGFLKVLKETESKSKDPYITQLENEVEMLKNSLFFRDIGQISLLEKSMLDRYSEFATSTCSFDPLPAFPRDMHAQMSIEIEYKSMKKLNLSREALVKELEWEYTQAKIHKLDYEEKIKALEESEKSLGRSVKDIQTEIQKKIKAVEKDKLKAKDFREKVLAREERVKNSLDKIKEEALLIKESLNFETVLVNATNSLCPTPKNRELSDVSTEEILEQEIKNLEDELETSVDKGSLTFKINHLKNKLSVERSEKVLTDHVNNKKFNSFGSFRMIAATPRAFGQQRFDFNLDLQKLPVAGTPRVMNNRAFTCFPVKQSPDISWNPSPQTTTRSNALSQVSENIEKDESLSKMLEMKEIRLRKKEEDLIKKEMQLQNSWMKEPDANELIPIVQNQIMSYRAKNHLIDQRSREIDELIKENMQTRKNIKEIEDNSRKLMKSLQEKLKVAEKLENLCLQISNIPSEF